MPLPGELVRDEAGKGERQGALAGAGRPDDEQAFPGLQREREIPDGRIRRPLIAERDAVGGDPDGPDDRRSRRRTAQAGNPSIAPLRRSARTRATATSGRMTIPEIAMKPPMPARAAASYVA